MTNRWDAVGLWWQDFPVEKAARAVREVRSRTPPPVPDTGWRTPTELPNLSNVIDMCVDVETYDPELLSMGPGAVRGAGHIVGYAIGTRDARWYFPVRHEWDGGRGNMDAENVRCWVRDMLAERKRRVYGANLMYDLEFLACEGVHLHKECELHDVQFAEPLLDEYARSYSLDALGLRYDVGGKVDEALYEWCSRAYGGPAGRKQAANIYRAPVELVGPYAEGDVHLPFLIADAQRKALEEEGLWPLYRLECRLIPLLLAMRLRGVPVDVAKAEQALVYASTREENAVRRAGELAGTNVDVWSAEALARAFRKQGISHDVTPTGQPSFTQQSLARLARKHELAACVLEARKYAKARSPFIEGYVLGYASSGRLHGQFHPLRTDENGTVSGRLSSSNPNLQNLPARERELKKLIRGLFVPEPGCQWRKYDYSQIEYRLLVHFAHGPGVEVVRDKYRTDPLLDYHEITRALIESATGRDIGRKPAKNINFGLVYGMGSPLLASVLGLPIQEAEELLDSYHSAVPFVRETYNGASRVAQRRGYVKTLLGRRARFPWWGPRRFDRSAKPVMDEQSARDQWGQISRAFTHKALNRVLQGSAADLIKKAMHDLWYSGVLDVTGVPYLNVHDELDFNDPMTAESEEAFTEVARMMEQCVKLKIPVVVDKSVGKNWGECE